MKPEDKGSQGKKDAAPGQERVRTITNASTGETQSLSMYEIKARRDELIAAGWSGPGLDQEDTVGEEGADTSGGQS